MARFDLARSGLTDDRGYIAARAELNSLIIAPLIAAGTALGVLVVFRDVTEELHDDTDLEPAPTWPSGAPRRSTTPG